MAGFYEPAPTVFQEKEILPGLFAMTMDTEASLREYLKLQLRIPVAGRIGPLAKAFDFVATAAPGVREILTVGKPVYEVRERNYDLVVVDAPASGHIVGLLAAPQAINNLVKVGLIRSQTDWLLEILSDTGTTGLVAVCTPEEMPVNETVELAQRMKDRDHRPAVGGGGQPGPTRALRAARGKGIRRPGQAARLDPLDGLVGGDAGPLLAAARLAVTMRRTRRPTSTACAGSIDKSVPMLYLPYLFTRSHGLRTTRQVAASLGEELGTGGGRRSGRRVTAGSRSARPGGAVRPPPGGVDGRAPGRQGDRGRLRAGRGGQDDHGRRRRRHGRLRHGSKVLVLTVDPAKRLADALGLDGIGNAEHRVPDEAFRPAGISRGASCGRPCWTPRSRGTTSCAGTPPTNRPGMRSWPTLSTRTSPVVSSKATTTSPWSVSTRSTRTATTTSSWWTPRPPATLSISSTPPSAWPISSRPVSCGG